MTKLYRPWLLPVLVTALVAPPIAGFALAGPPVGLALGALAVGVLVLAAVLARGDEPIEVPPPSSSRYRLLAVAIEPIDEPELASQVAAALPAGAAGAAAGRQEYELLVLAPALNTRVAHWLSDVGEARFDAQRRLALSLGTLAAAGVDARGRVGDADVVQAVEDALRDFPAQRLLFVTSADDPGHEVGQVRRRLARPVGRLVRPGQATSSSSRR